MNIEELETKIKNELGIMIYFSGEQCGVCHALRPKIKELFSESFPLIEQIFLDANENIDIASHLGVFSIPTIILFLDGKEFVREGRNMSIAQLGGKIERIYDIMSS